MVEAPPLPLDIRRLPDGAIELMPWILPLRLDRAQQRELISVLAEGLDDEDPRV